MNINPFSDSGIQADAALYFLPQGHYLFRWQQESGLVGSKFVTPDDVQAAFTQAERDTGWLPPGIVRAGYGKSGEWFVMFAPPHKLTINLMELGVLTIPVPALVFAGAGRSYYLWAAQEKVFSPQMKIFDAPFPNVQKGGQICWGNNTPPLAGPANAQAAWQLFFGSPFNNHLVSGKTRRHSEDVRQLLVKLQGKHTFPAGQLNANQGLIEGKISRLKGT